MSQVSRIVVFAAISSMGALAQQQVLMSPVPFLKGDGTIATPGQETGIFFDVKNSQAVVFYRPVDNGGIDNGGMVKKFVVPLSSQIEPEIISSISRRGSQYLYTFTVSNNLRSKQAINRVALPRVPNGSLLETVMPAGWLSLSRKPHIEWTGQDGALVVAPGTKVVFTFVSDKKPGLIQAIMQGQTTGYTIPADIPKGLTDELAKFITSPTNTKQYLVFGPKFSPDTPQTVIKADFGDTIKFLIELHQLDAGSDIVKQMISGINGTAYFSPTTQSGHASSPREAEVNSALSMALGSQ
ncbi:MAG TPA: hypothetical protein VK638_20920 [Edaphobacter sp.]|nr:hypothetical protein [Edaphobacter sp.]